MRKVTATVIYKNNEICNLTVNFCGVLVCLALHETVEKASNEKRTFQSLYKTVLKILKNNNYYCNYQEEFGVRWYDIQFINLENPVEIEKFGINSKRAETLERASTRNDLHVLTRQVIKGGENHESKLDRPIQSKPCKTRMGG